jgi:hypothetical protein
MQPLFLAVRRPEPASGEEEAPAQRLIGVLALTADRGLARTLGDANVRDYGGPFATDGEVAAVANGANEWLFEDLTLGLELWGLTAAGEQVEAFRAAADSFGWDCETVPESVAPVVGLPGDWEAYVAQLGKHDRHELRRKLRHLAAAGDVSFRVTKDPTEIGAPLDELLRMMHVSREDKDAFLTPAMEAFFRDIVHTFTALGMVRLCTLAIDGRPVASTLSFVHGETQYLYNSGYEPEAASLAVGLLSKALGIRAAIEEGLHRFDFLRGEEEYKHHLGGTGGEIVTLRAGKAVQANGRS